MGHAHLCSLTQESILAVFSPGLGCFWWDPAEVPGFIPALCTPKVWWMGGPYPWGCWHAEAPTPQCFSHLPSNVHSQGIQSKPLILWQVSTRHPLPGSTPGKSSESVSFPLCMPSLFLSFGEKKNLCHHFPLSSNPPACPQYTQCFHQQELRVLVTADSAFIHVTEGNDIDSDFLKSLCTF